MSLIYFVEDDQSIRELVLYALQNSGFQVMAFENGEELLAQMQVVLPTLLLLDVMLPNQDGFQILTKIKKNTKTSNFPIIMLTAKNTEYDKIKCLDHGADDYITKPFGIMELISRIKAVLRRSTTPKEVNCIAYKNMIVNNTKRTVTVDGQICNLTFKEFELLYYLLKNQTIVLTRENIMNAVWGFDFEGETRTVDMHIKTIRKKIGSLANEIQTVRGVGYKIGE